MLPVPFLFNSVSISLSPQNFILINIYALNVFIISLQKHIYNFKLKYFTFPVPHVSLFFSSMSILIITSSAHFTNIHPLKI